MMVVGLAILIELHGGQRLALLKSRVSEFFLVQHDGPRLGSRPASSSIALVLVDKKTVEKLGPYRSYNSDLKVFEKLVDSGAAVVYDSRNLAVSSPDVLQQVQPLLDGIVKLNQRKLKSEAENSSSAIQTQFLYDAWLSHKIGDTDMSDYARAATLNPLSIQPHSVAYQRVRQYPIGNTSMIGVKETAPLMIVRAFRNSAQVETKSLVNEIVRCGIYAEHNKLFPNPNAQFDELPSPYQFLNSEIPWVPFATSDPTLFPAGFQVSHDPTLKDFRRLSFVDVLEETTPSELGLKGKIVIVGYWIDYDPADDAYELPGAPGKRCSSEMIALATQTLLDQRWQRTPPEWIRLALIVGVCVGLALLTSRLKPIAAVIATVIVMIAYLGLAVYGYRAGWNLDFVVIPIAGLVAAIQGGAFSAWRNYRAHLRVVDMFGRYVPRAVVNQLILKPELEALRLGGSKREVTVVFADIRGFTSFSEKLPPDQVVAELNSLLQVMVECTFEFQGTLDKFIGDAILVLFNAPLNQSDHTLRAVRMALDMQARIAKHSTRLSIGIGVHVGDAVVGNIGTPQRMEYTAIGSTVNIASRLCDVAQAGKVIVSKEVHDLIDGKFSAESIGPVKVKGIDEPIAVWSIQNPQTQLT
jgi:class 3 adenylate cyclase